MPEFELFQERLISGKGVLRVPKELKKRRACILYCDVVRPPTSPYYNFNYSPRKSRYGSIVFIRNKYVISEDSIGFESQSWDAVPDITAQNLIAIKCMYDGLLKSFVNQNTALGLLVTSVEDKIKDYTYLDLMWDEVRITCYADTALNVRLFALKNDTCDPDKDKPQKPPPPPPPPPPLPPGTPIGNISPPYDEPDDPDDITKPYDGDESTPPPDEPPGQTCEVYEFDVYVKLSSEPAFKYFNHYKAYAPVELNMPPNPGFLSSCLLTSRGSTAPTGTLPEECGVERVEGVGLFVGLEDCELRNFTPSTK